MDLNHQHLECRSSALTVELQRHKTRLATSGGFEPPTFALTERRYLPLSYEVKYVRRFTRRLDSVRSRLFGFFARIFCSLELRVTRILLTQDSRYDIKFGNEPSYKGSPVGFEPTIAVSQTAALDR